MQLQTKTNFDSTRHQLNMISKFSKFVISINTSILLVCVPHILFNLHYIAIITGIVWFILSSFDINKIFGPLEFLYGSLMKKGLGVMSQMYKNENSQKNLQKVTKKALRQMNHEQLVELSKRSNIILPVIGSGKNKKVLKKDIVNTLYDNLRKT